MKKCFSDYCNDNPYAQFLGVTVDDDGVFKIFTTKDMIGNYVIQALHGGVITSLLEIASSITIAHYFQFERSPKVINLNFNFFKPAQADSIICVKTELIKVGQRIIHTQAIAYSENKEKHLAHLNANYLTQKK